MWLHNILFICGSLSMMSSSVYETQGTRSCVRVRAMVFNVTFNNISVISWPSVLLVEETRVPRENH